MATRTFLEFKSDKENSWPVRGKTYRPILTLLFIAVGVWAVIISDKTFAEANSYDVLYHKAMLGSEANIVDTVDVNLRNPATRQNLFDFNGKLYYFNHDYEYEIWVYDYNFDFLYRLDDFSFFISDMFMCNSTLYVFADYSNPEISDRIYRLGEDDVFYYVMDLDMPDIINLLQTDEGYVYFDYQDWWGDYYIDGKTEKSIRISTFNEYSIHNANDYEDNEIIYMNDDCLICTKDGVLTILRNFENEHSYFKYQSGVVCVGSVDDLKIYTVDDYINGGTPLFAYEFDGYKLYRLKDIYISNGRYVINTYGYDSEYTRSMWEANTYESSCSFVFSSEGELESAFIKNDYLYIGENNTILSVYDDSEEEYTYYAVDMNDLGNVAYAKSGDYRSQAVYLIAIVVFTFAFVDTNLLNWLSRIINDSRGDFLINDTEDRNK